MQAVRCLTAWGAQLVNAANVLMLAARLGS